MSFYYSQDSLTSMSSDFSSSAQSSVSSRTLGNAGARILNSSYPLVNKKNELKKDNETYAYLEKLKPAQKEENRIEHIHHMRYLDFLDYSFKRVGKDLNAMAKSDVVEVSYKENEDYGKMLDNSSKLSELRHSLVSIRYANNEHKGTVLPCNFVLTNSGINKNYLKLADITDSQGNILYKNKFGPFIKYKEFFLFTIRNQVPALNPYISFKLNKLDKVFLLSSNGQDESFSVIDITQQYFVFTSLIMKDFVKAEPVFSKYCELQGFFSHSILNMHFVTRLEPIFSFLILNQKEQKSDELDNFLSFYSRKIY